MDCRLLPIWTLGLLLLAGCGTTRVTDTSRTATEQLLVARAIDESVAAIDFRPLAGKTVFFDPQYLDSVTDRGYLISSLRQQLLASGALLQEDRNKATYVVEARAGSVGTDRHSLLVGIPQTQLPVLTPTMPTHIPEIPFAKSTDQKGVAKIAVFAYNRMTGQAVMQSGLHMASSSARDRWLLGLGPFQSGTIRDYTEFAGEPLWFSRGRDEAETAIGPLGPLQANWWEEAPGSPTKPGGSNFACDRAPPPPASADAKPPPTGATPSPQPTVAPASGTVPAAGGPTSVVPAVAPGGSTAPVGPPPLPPPGS